MDMKLVRDYCGEDGTFGVLYDSQGAQVCQTLERVWDDGSGILTPKVPEGTYLCVRGVHRLSNMVPFETFEVTGVEEHQGILLHVANLETQLDGCIALGENRGTLSGHEAVLQSGAAFRHFMTMQDGCASFRLTIEDMS